MLFKHVPPLSGLTSGLTSLLTSCTKNGIAGTLLLILISIDKKLGGLYLKLGKIVWYACSSSR
jgi:hypothetical protein